MIRNFIGFVTVSLLFISNPIFSQTKDVSSKSEQFQLYEMYYEDINRKQLEVQGHFYHGKEHGEWKFWYRNGKLKQVCFYKMGVLDSTSTLYYENGNKEMQSDFDFGTQHGGHSKWYENGKLAEKGTFVKGIKSGKWEEYYENGNKKLTGEYLNNNENGFFTFWHPNGKKSKEAIYKAGIDSLLNAWDKDGKPTVENGNGSLLEFYNNGSKKSIANYKNGNLTGVLTKYYENGNIWYKTEYLNRVRNGLHLLYFTNGQVKDSTNYKEGHEHGQWFQFDYKGNMTGNGFYKMGIEDSLWQWYEGGFKKMEGNFKMGKRHGKWTNYFKGKKLISRIAYYHENKKDGTWRYNYPDGSKMKVVNFKDDKRNGLLTVYYENGQKEHEGSFKDDKEHGEWASWYKNGTPNEKGSFNMGVMDGTWEGFYQKEGYKRYLITYKNGVKNGPYEKYFPKNKTGIKCNYKDGYLEGMYTDYHKNGFSIREQGKYVIVPRKLDTVKSAKYVKAIGKENLKKIPKRASEDFKTKKLSKFESVKDGPWTVYLENTNMQPHQIVTYKKGVLHGKMVMFHPNGKIRAEIPYKNGLKHGTAKFYNKEGKRVAKKKYKLNNEIKKKGKNKPPVFPKKR